MQWPAPEATSATAQRLRARIEIIAKVFGQQASRNDAGIEDWDAALLRGKIPN